MPRRQRQPTLEIGLTLTLGIGLHGIPSVHREIDDDLLELLRVGANGSQFAIVANGELDLAAHQPLEQLAHLADHVGHLQHHRAQRLLAAEGEQLASERGGAVGIGLDLLDVVVIAVARRVAQQHKVAIADDRSEHIVEIMRHAACQLTHRLHLGGLRDLAPQALLFRRVGQGQEDRRIAQPAHPGEPDAHRLFLVAPQSHRHVAARRDALGKASYGVGDRRLVFGDDKVGGKLGQTGFFPIDSAQERLIGEQEAAVAVGQRQPQRQCRKQGFELRNRRAPAALPRAADPHAAVDQQHQRRRLVGTAHLPAAGLVERDVDQSLRRSLLPFAGEIYPVAVVGTKQLDEILPRERAFRIAGRPLGQPRGVVDHDAIGRDQSDLQPGARYRRAEWPGNALPQPVVAAVLDDLVEPPDQIVLAAPAALHRNAKSPFAMSETKRLGLADTVAPCRPRGSVGGLPPMLVQSQRLRLRVHTEPVAVGGIGTGQPVRTIGDRNGGPLVLDRRMGHRPIGRREIDHGLCGLQATGQQQAQHESEQPPGVGGRD